MLKKILSWRGGGGVEERWGCYCLGGEFCEVIKLQCLCVWISLVKRLCCEADSGFICQSG